MMNQGWSGEEPCTWGIDLLMLHDPSFSFFLTKTTTKQGRS